ncbi:hypothetical protein IEQ34_018147 [Dendrobium chrysotoxum]|uniref:Uncharacterized protein n=1 Tax=Dendrobium chrysotoxum TaxID=161865 RepID=A0AAV7GDK7_DENCH|nr:hypothetical protein IEQ34_018147 [Dendrobium chrysotoxum]
MQKFCGGNHPTTCSYKMGDSKDKWLNQSSIDWILHSVSTPAVKKKYKITRSMDKFNICTFYRNSPN